MYFLIKSTFSFWGRWGRKKVYFVALNNIWKITFWPQRLRKCHFNFGASERALWILYQKVNVKQLWGQLYYRKFKWASFFCKLNSTLLKDPDTSSTFSMQFVVVDQPHSMWLVTSCNALGSIQVNNYEIVVNLFHISHNLTWYSAIFHKFTRIYPVCSTYELTKQFM